MITQDALFDAPVKPVVDRASKLPPEPPKPVIQAESLGPCCKCGADGTVSTPNGKYIYCDKCGKCGHKYITETALGIQVRECGKSVDTFVVHPRLGIYVCTCLSGI